MLTDERRRLADDIVRDGAIGEDDVLALRRLIFPDGIVGPEEVALILELDARPAARGPAWERLYVEALTDHYVWQQFPPGVVSEAAADDLLRHLLKDGRIEATTEFRLLVHVIETAKWCPERLVLAAMGALPDVVLRRDGGLASAVPHRAGAIDAADVDLLRKLLYGISGDCGIGVSRAEADLLAELNEATRGADNDPSWPDLFAKAIGQFVLRPGRVVMTPDEHLRRERWLEERGRPGDFAARMRDGLANGGGLAEAFRSVMAALFGGVDPHEQEAMERLAAQYGDDHPAGRIDAAETRWLLDHVGRAATLSPAETALLRFLAAEAPTLPDDLRPLCARAGA